MTTPNKKLTKAEKSLILYDIQTEQLKINSLLKYDNSGTANRILTSVEYMFAKAKELSQC